MRIFSRKEKSQNALYSASASFLFAIVYWILVNLCYLYYVRVSPHKVNCTNYWQNFLICYPGNVDVDEPQGTPPKQGTRRDRKVSTTSRTSLLKSSRQRKPGMRVGREQPIGRNEGLIHAHTRMPHQRMPRMRKKKNADSRDAKLRPFSFFVKWPLHIKFNTFWPPVSVLAY